MTTISYRKNDHSIINQITEVICNTTIVWNKMLQILVYKPAEPNMDIVTKNIPYPVPWGASFDDEPCMKKYNPSTNNATTT